MAESSRTQITYRYERLRAVSAGVLETAANTFLLLIAVRAYHSGALWKSAVGQTAQNPRARLRSRVTTEAAGRHLSSAEPYTVL